MFAPKNFARKQLDSFEVDFRLTLMTQKPTEALMMKASEKKHNTTMSPTSPRHFVYTGDRHRSILIFSFFGEKTKCAEIFSRFSAVVSFQTKISS